MGNFNPTTSEIIEGIAISLLLIFIVFLIIFGFMFVIRIIKSNINVLTNEMVNTKSEIIIDINEKIVYKKNLNNKNNSDNIESMSLDDFIYSISLNPESKIFRELLKLIENDAPKTQIISKFKSIEEHEFFITLKYSENRASIARVSIKKELKNIDGYFKFNLDESYFAFRKKELFQNILQTKIEPLNKQQLFQAITKDVKSIRTKGWTLIKIKNSNFVLPSKKDYSTNIIQMTKLKFLLKQEGIDARLSKNGSLYFAQHTGRNSDHFWVQKNWSNKINSLLNINKLYYFDITSDEVVVSTSNGTIKDTRNINTALIIVDMISELDKDEKNSRHIYQEIKVKTEQINENVYELNRNIRDSLIPINKTEYSIRERSPKSVVEFYLDLDVSIVSDIINYSYKYKDEIINEIVKAVQKESKKYHGKICTLMFEMKSLPLLEESLVDENSVNNFYISIKEDDSKYPRGMMNEMFSNLRKRNYKFVHLISDIDDGSAKIHISMKPDYILYTKDFSKVIDTEEKINISHMKLSNVKEKNVKILNVK